MQNEEVPAFQSCATLWRLSLPGVSGIPWPLLCSSNDQPGEEPSEVLVSLPNCSLSYSECLTRQAVEFPFLNVDTEDSTYISPKEE